MPVAAVHGEARAAPVHHVIEHGHSQAGSASGDQPLVNRRQLKALFLQPVGVDPARGGVGVDGEQERLTLPTKFLLALHLGAAATPIAAACGGNRVGACGAAEHFVVLMARGDPRLRTIEFRIDAAFLTGTPSRVTQADARMDLAGGDWLWSSVRSWDSGM